MILNFFKYSFWSGKIPSKETKLIPKFFYFNGGPYFKTGIVWFKRAFEISGPKKDTSVYVKVTKKEINKIIKDLKKKYKRAKHQNRTGIR